MRITRLISACLRFGFYVIALILFALLVLLTFESVWQILSDLRSPLQYATGAIFFSFLLASLIKLCNRTLEQASRASFRRPSTLFRELWERPNYIQFVWLGSTFALVGMVCTGPQISKFIFEATSRNILFRPSLSFDAPWWAGVAIMLLSFSLYFSLLSRPRTKERPRFSPGAVSAGGDALDFEKLAKAELRMLNESGKMMQVIMVTGSMGSGKSSFLRMIMEGANNENMLYNYISLTETDNTKPYSKLFAERWARSIESRYPSINFGADQAILESIAREVRNNWLGVVMNFCKEPRWPLQRTRVKYCDDERLIGEYLPSRVASLFNHISHFSEQHLVIVIDEVERARFSEIYQAIEIIERFRYESQWGLPIKLTFILCVDSNYLLYDRIGNSVPSNEETKLIKAFFDGTKLVDRIIYLPVVDPSRKQDFIITRIRRLIEENSDKISSHGLGSIEGLDDILKLYWPLESAHPRKQDGRQRWDDKRAYDYMLTKLLDCTPREVNKILDRSQALIRQYYQVGKRAPNQIRFSDFILLTYAMNKPLFMEFIHAVLPLVFEEDMGILGEEGSLMASFHNHRDDKPETFPELFKQKIKHSVPKKDVEEMLELTSAICYPIVAYTLSYERTYNGEFKHVYDRTLGLYENLRDVLDLATKMNDSIYLTTQAAEVSMNMEGKMPLGFTTSEELLGLSRNLRRYFSGDYKASWVIAKEIVGRMTNDKIEKSPSSDAQNTVYSNLTYSFLFHFCNFTNRDDAKISECLDLLDTLLQSDAVLVESKLTIIDNLFGNREITSESAFAFDTTRKKLEKEDQKKILGIVKSVIQKGLNIYGESSKKSIYDCEENFLYVLYQLWDGKDNTTSIQGIAKKDLSQKIKAIEVYWKRERNLKPLNSSGFDEHSELPLPINELIRATREAGLSDTYAQDIKHWEENVMGHSQIPPIKAPLPGRLTLTQKLTTLGYLS